MLSSNGTFVNRLLMSKEHINVLAGRRLQYWIKLAYVKEFFMHCEEYNVSTGAKISANYLASSCWEEPIIAKMGLSGVFPVCWASHTFAGTVGLCVKLYHKHHKPGYFGLLSLRDVFATSARS